MKNVIDPVIQRNAVFAHPENMFLAMLTDDRDSIQHVAHRRILSADLLDHLWSTNKEVCHSEIEFRCKRLFGIDIQGGPKKMAPYGVLLIFRPKIRIFK